MPLIGPAPMPLIGPAVAVVPAAPGSGRASHVRPFRTRSRSPGLSGRP